MRRYLLVSEALLAQGHEPVFLFLEKNAKTIYDEETVLLGFDLDITLSNFYKVSAEVAQLDNVPRTAPFAKPPPAKMFTAREGSLKIGDNAELARVTEAVGFATEYYFGRNLYDHTNLFAINFKAAEGIFDAFDPVGLVFDIEYVPATAAVIFAANERSIPVFSLQHSVGYGMPYSNLPAIADYYFAYSQSNFDILTKMGVAKENIFLTGDPDSHAYAVLNNLPDRKSAYRESLCINPQDKVLTIALKPCEEINSKLFLQDNIELLEITAKAFSGTPDFLINVRRHPRDKLSTNPVLEAVFDRYDVKVTFIDITSPIERFLLASDYFLQFPSAAIVEAIECCVPSCVISTDYGATWPDWGKHGAYRVVSIDQVGQFLEQIKSGGWPEISRSINLARENFLEEFSRNQGPDCAKNIALRIFSKT